MAIEINTSAGNSIEVTQSDGTSVTFNQETSSVSVSSPASTSVQVLEKGVKGDKGDTGDTGATGPQGETGPGVASGGTENQFIQKNSATDYDTKWSAYTLPAADGDDGQVLTTNGAATVTFAYPKTIAEDVKNVSGGPLTKGTPVHVTGSVGNLAEVIAADAATNYPAHFVLNEDLADDQEGLGIAIGFINNVNVPDASIYTEGQTVYLGESGGWTTTKPTGANAIQNLGIIIKVNTSGNKISGIIMGAGRANDVPNIATGNIWAGNADGVATATSVAYIDIANERVGIGTTSPSVNLELGTDGTAVQQLRLNSDLAGSYFALESLGNIARLKATNGTNLMVRSDGSGGYITNWTGGSERMRIDSSGNVGIGTGSPSKKLHVSGGDALIQNATASNTFLDVKGTSSNAYIRAYSDSNSVWLYQGGNSSYLQAQSGSTMRVGSGTGNLIFSDTSGEVMRTSSGKVGIGVTSPAEKLEVLGNIRLNTVGNQLEFSNANVALQRGASNVLELGGYGGIAFKASAAAIDSQTERMRITDAGNVGIGTTSPSEEFEVVGDAKVTNLGINASADGYLSSLSARLSVGGNVVVNTSNPLLYLRSNNTGNDSDIRYQTALKFTNGSGATHAVINSSGNVGIGTASPDESLHVNGKILVAANDIAYAAGYFTRIKSNYSDNPFVLESRAGILMSARDYGRTLTFYAGPDGNTAEVMRVDESGNVGIGTTSPTYNLDVQGPTNGIIRAYGPSIGRLSLQNSTSHYSTSVQGNKWYFFDESGGASRMVIDSSGNVGIGTTTPSSKLDVNGGVTASGPVDSSDATSTSITSETARFNKYGLMGNRSVLHITNENPSGDIRFGISGTHGVGTKMTLKSSGNFGIGTLTPSAKLDVVGLANINDGSNNVMISSGNTALTTGTNNTALGYQAGINNTEGIENVFFGRNSGFSTTTGSNNSFIGGYAGNSNTTGSNNTAVGWAASYSNTTGFSNTAVGRNALYNSTGSLNVAVGRDAALGGAGASFSNTVAVGYQALYDLTTGAHNTAIGYQASANTTTGGYNVSVGNYALWQNQTGTANTALGYGAAYKTTSNNTTAVGYLSAYEGNLHNAALGSRALNYSTGSYNTAVGSYAAQGVPSVSTFSNTTAVGYEALVGLTTGSENSAVGYYALRNTTTGSYNTAFGVEALRYNIGGGYNTSFGVNALRNNQTGNYNTAGGYHSMRNANSSIISNTALGYNSARDVTGNANTAVGHEASFSGGAGNTSLGWRAGRSAVNYNVSVGYGAASNTTGSYNTVTGYNAALGDATSTFSNTVAVGYETLKALTTGAQNTAVGYQALLSVTTANNNTAIGHEALEGSNTSYNTAVGTYSLQYNTAGERNTAVGWYALGESTGSYNVSLGMRAGEDAGSGNTSLGYDAARFATGNNNVIIGKEAGFGVSATSTFSNTVAVGYQALYDLTTGASNTAVGYNAGANISSGDSNTSVGFEALTTTTTADNNSAFGKHALRWNTTGGSNTGIGAAALYNTTGGVNNTAVGSAALNNNVSGNQNVAIGRISGYSSLGSGNVFLGYSSGYYETGSNKLYIANSDTTTPLIYGDFSLGEITINGDLKVSGGNLRADAVEINGRALTTPATGEYGAGSRLVTQFASGTVTAGKVYVANAGAWAEGDANAGSTSIGMIAVATDTASATEMLIEGVIKLSSNTGFSGAAAGTVLYLSTTAGELTTTAPSTAGEYVRVCGYVVNASTNEVFFSPSRDWTAL